MKTITLTKEEHEFLKALLLAVLMKAHTDKDVENLETIVNIQQKL